jgi:hypothetical protein
VRDLLVELVLIKDAPARFDLVGDAQEVGEAESAAAVLAFLNQNPGQWFLADALVEGVGKRRGDVRGVLPGLVGKRRIARTGKGAKGSPFLYATVGTRPPASPGPAEDAAEDSVPRPSHSVPGTESGGAPPAAEDSVPAVPAPLWGAERGTESTARGKDSKSPPRPDDAGNRNGVPETASPGVVPRPSATEAAPPVQGPLDFDRRREDVP